MSEKKQNILATIIGIGWVVIICYFVAMCAFSTDEPEQPQKSESPPAIFHFEFSLDDETLKKDYPAVGFLFSCPRWLTWFVEEKPAWMMLLDKVRCEEPDGTVEYWSPIDIRDEVLKQQR